MLRRSSARSICACCGQCCCSAVGACMHEEGSRRGMLTLGGLCSAWGRHRRVVGQQQQGSSGIMHTEQQSSRRGAWACCAGAVHEASVHAAISAVAQLLAHACMRSEGEGGCSRLVIGVQRGGAISVSGENNNRVALASCTLSRNQAKEVRGHAPQEQ